MTTLAEIAQARKVALSSFDLKRILIYAQPKAGKTLLAGSVAKVANIKRVFWFDLENGAATLLNPELGLTQAEMKKVTLYSIPDTRESPIGIETCLKVVSSQKPSYICDTHGRVNCRDCMKAPAPKPTVELPEIEGNTIFPGLAALTASDCVVFDSLSQVGDSAFEVGSRVTAGDKSAYAKYAEQGRMLSDLLGMIQQMRTNVICITHVTTNEAEDTKKETVIPLCGTRNFSLKVAKYFSTVIYLSVEVKKFKAGSSPTYKLNVIAGDRLGVKLEASNSPSMLDIFN